MDNQDRQAIFARLALPFRGKDLEWRVQRAGIKRGTGEPYAVVVPYVNARSIMERLDTVLGPDNWQTDMRPTGPMGKTKPESGMFCGIGIRVNGEWIWKWDAAQASDIEPVKGAASGALKRAAVQLGMGRDLYDVGDLYAVISERGKEYTSTEVKDPAGSDKKIRITFKWDPPNLPLPAQEAADGPAGVSPVPPQPKTELEQAITPSEKQLEFAARLLQSHVFTDVERDSHHKWVRVRGTRANMKERIDLLRATLKDRKDKEAQAATGGGV